MQIQRAILEIEQIHFVMFDSFLSKYNLYADRMDGNAVMGYYHVRKSNGYHFTENEIFGLGQLWYQYLNQY